MIHNGIEHGMMSAQSEAWQIMSLCLGMTYDEIGDEFAKWNAHGELVRNQSYSSTGRNFLHLSQRGTFLIDIGAQINKQRDDKGKHVLSMVEDKVVQDIDGSEGTGVLSVVTKVLTTMLIGRSRSGLQKRRSGCMFLLLRFQTHTTFE